MVVFQETGIQGAVRGRVLIEMVENAEDRIELEAEDNSLVIKDSRSELKLPMLPPDTFLFELPDTDKVKASISGDLDTMLGFMEGLELAANNSNEESLRPELVGVTVLVDERATLYSTDNISCTKVTLTQVDADGEAIAVLPKSSCQLIAKTFRDLRGSGLAECGVYVLKDSVLVSYALDDDEPAVWVVCKTVPVAKPADYEGILERNLEEGEFFDVPDGLEQALSRASAMFKDDYSRAVTLAPAEDAALLLSCKGEYGELSADLNSEGVPAEEVVMNPDLVRRMLGTCHALMFCTNAMAMVSESDHSEVLYLVAYKRA